MAPKQSYVMLDLSLFVVKYIHLDICSNFGILYSQLRQWCNIKVQDIPNLINPLHNQHWLFINPAPENNQIEETF